MRLLCALLAGFCVVSPVASVSAQQAAPLGVVFVGGYGANFEEATYHFSALRSAVLERSPSAVLVQYSYLGTSFDGCAASPTPYLRSDTAQDVEMSKQVLRETLRALRESCDVERVVVVGHSHETQWLGMPNAVRKDFPAARGLAQIGTSQSAVLMRSASELADFLLPLGA